ncbi:MAG: hypothetical protein HC835_06560 [Oscillatoriales cyanobacterium RM2_1_1]|nr:hypothetical protein [Oscillatoriales cyanobacterium SM2_3_0]NJO45310.1 hypothetical protein [Oscillatoriales cyanobacterium RM2_1_1]
MNPSPDRPVKPSPKPDLPGSVHEPMNESKELASQSPPIVEDSHPQKVDASKPQPVEEGSSEDQTVAEAPQDLVSTGLEESLVEQSLVEVTPETENPVEGSPVEVTPEAENPDIENSATALSRKASSDEANEEHLDEEHLDEERLEDKKAEEPSDEERSTAASPDEESSEEESSESDRTWLHPIPPPSEPRQYRAIGLVQGRYTASEEQFTQGILVTAEGAIIDAVLLGRVMSLVKKHIDLDQEHLWVVYPRTRQNEENLHVQIVGVWEPETLRKSEDEVTAEPEIDPGLEVEPEAHEVIESGAEAKLDKEFSDQLSEQGSKVKHGYFSIRGEAVYQSQDEEKYAIIKIRQASRKESEKPKFFKLKLLGFIGPKAVGRFWDLHVQLAKDTLVIQEGHDIGVLPVKRRSSGPPFRGGGGGRPPFRKSPGQFSNRPTGEKPKPVVSPVRRDPDSKPTKPQPKTPDSKDSNPE